MKITLTEHDIYKMPVELRKALMQFIFNREDESNPFYDNPPEEMEFDYEEPPLQFNDAPFPEDESTKALNKSKKSKNVIEIDKRQAKELISNLSDKSIDILMEFTTEAPVPLSTLIGEGKPYSTFVELKRSFVGPVNRRLRTVTGNRTAVLFLKVDEDDVNIAVKKATADALESVLKLNEGI